MSEKKEASHRSYNERSGSNQATGSHGFTGWTGCLVHDSIDGLTVVIGGLGASLGWDADQIVGECFAPDVALDAALGTIGTIGIDTHVGPAVIVGRLTARGGGDTNEII